MPAKLINEIPCGLALSGIIPEKTRAPEALLHITSDVNPLGMESYYIG